MQSANRRTPLRSADNSPFRRHFTLTPLLFFFYVLYYIQYYTVCQEVSRFLFKMFFRRLYTAVYFTRPLLAALGTYTQIKFSQYAARSFFITFLGFFIEKRKVIKRKKNPRWKLPTLYSTKSAKKHSRLFSKFVSANL